MRFGLSSKRALSRWGKAVTAENCRHAWEIINLRNGYLVTEGCTHCGRRANFFTLEDRNHMDSYVEGKHIWGFLGSSQAVKFDFKCTLCGKEIKLDKVMALMACLDCKEDCLAPKKGREKSGDEDSWVYLALCPDPGHENEECIGSEEIKALNSYFNSRIKTPGKRITIIPCLYRGKIDTCQGEIIADVGMKDLF